ncbi:anaerobic ribonucleoside-triphosphate reductase activating protein [Demequina sp. NBRC 110055]|uniref:anaerobic ribonucleoside-triphosphate reductase activating protein n=1 Tax=Demequina sp. NBRC 110055 TaxID=1570344 RepID=UPI000A014DBB|nr:anaerobic ribonucleoside-triphosphate reductase activating protein [Demequina sp. NBRC 110055]
MPASAAFPPASPVITAPHGDTVSWWDGVPWFDLAPWPDVTPWEPPAPRAMPAPGSPATLAISRYLPATTMLWRGRTVAALFLQGCPWTCGYCLDPSMRRDEGIGRWTWADVVADVTGVHRDIDGIVFTGGEPTRQAALLPAMAFMREAGLGIALHTGGAYPARLERALPLVDFVSLDIKGQPSRYGAVTGSLVAGDAAWRSLDILQASSTAFEVTITVDPTLHTRAEILDLADTLRARGVHRIALQEVIAGIANPRYADRLGGRGIRDVLTLTDLSKFTVR